MSRQTEFTHLEKLLMAWLLANGYIGIDLTQPEVKNDERKNIRES